MARSLRRRASLLRRIGFKSTKDLLFFLLLILLSACSLLVTHNKYLSMLYSGLYNDDAGELLTYPWLFGPLINNSTSTTQSQPTINISPLLVFPNNDTNSTLSTIVPYALGAGASSLNQHHLDKNDITMATHSSIHKMDRVEMQITRWGGPVSLAMYIATPNELQTLIETWSNHSASFQNTSIHVFMERNDNGTQLGYPHNELRNLALDHVTTNYFLAMDVDLVTTPNAHGELRELITTNPNVSSFLQQKGLFDLPALERLMPSEMTNSSINDTRVTLDMIPNTKDDLLHMVKNKTMKPFHNLGYPPHRATDFIKWYNFTQDISYPIQYSTSFEPYVLAYAPGIPRYFEGFRGFGYNKQVWFMELNLAKYQFRVLRDYFVIHLNHPGGGNKRRASHQNFLNYKEFRANMIRKYGEVGELRRVVP